MWAAGMLSSYHFHFPELQAEAFVKAEKAVTCVFKGLAVLSTCPLGTGMSCCGPAAATRV